MSSSFFDSSGLVRRYDSGEPGAELVERLCAPENSDRIFLSRLARLELLSALQRKLREGAFSGARLVAAWNAYLRHQARTYQLLAINGEVLTRAEDLIRLHHPLRAADAVHVATALILSEAQPGLELLFVTADRRQARAAEAEGLTVEFID